MDPKAYFVEHKLFNLDNLKRHAEQHLVKVITSEALPNIVMLHYKEEAHFDQKWSEFSRRCRGLIVDLFKRQILAYPYDKFFNLGEQPETQYESLKTLPFIASEKLDGSFLIHYWDERTSQARLSTKGSLDSEHGQYATNIMPTHLKKKQYTEDYTLMFELIDPKYRIVIDYNKKQYVPGIYLVGARSKNTNRLLSYTQLQTLSRVIDVPVVKVYHFENLDVLLENVNSLPQTEEGYVLEFENSLRVKIKSPAYLQAHKFISHLSDRNILEALKTGLEGTLLEVAPEEYREEIKNKIQFFKDTKEAIEKEVHSFFDKAPKDGRKEFALWVIQNVPQSLHGHLFSLFDKKPLLVDKLYNEIGQRSNISAETRI